MPRVRLHIADSLPVLVLGARARFLLSTAVVTLSLQAPFLGKAHADDYYLNNGHPSMYSQLSGDWDNNSRIWTSARDVNDHERLDPENDTAVLPGRTDEQTHVRLEIRNDVEVGIIRAESSHYTLAGRRGRLVGVYTELDADGNEIQRDMLIFELMADPLNPNNPTELKVLTSLAGNVALRGEGLFTYSGSSSAAMTSLTIGEDVRFVSTGESHGAMVNNGRVEILRDSGTEGTHQGDVENAGQITLAGEIDGTVTNSADAVLHMQGGSVTEGAENALGGLIRGVGEIDGTVNNEGRIEVAGGSNTLGRLLDVERIENRTGGVIAVGGGHRLETDALLNDGGRIEVQGGGRLSMTGNQALENAADGLIDIRNNGQLTGNVANGDTSQVLVNGALTGNVENSETAQLQIGGVLTGNVTNRDGATLGVNETGRIVGNITDNASSVATVIAGEVTGRVTNASTGTVQVTETGQIESLSNSGSFTLDQGGVVTGRIQSNTGNLVLNGAVRDTTTNSSGGTLTLGATGSLAQLQNSGTADLSGSTSGRVVNLGTGTTNLLDGASVSSLDNQGSGTVTVAQGATVRNGLIGNDGILNLDGEVVGNATNDAQGTLNINQTGVVTRDVTNNGTLNLAGTVERDVTNNEVLNLSGRVDRHVVNHDRLDLTGSVGGNVVNNSVATLGSDVAGSPARIGGDYQTIDGSQTILRGATEVAGNFLNNGAMTGQAGQDTSLRVGQTFTNNGTITGSSTAAINITAGHLAFGANSHITGRVLLNGSVANNGQIDYNDPTTAILTGDLLNTPGGRVNVSVGLDGAGYTIDNYSAFNITETGAVTGLNAFNNHDGHLDIAAGGQLAANTITNAASSNVTNAGVIRGEVTSSGTLTSTGTIMGALTTDRTSQTTLSGAVGGAISNGGQMGTSGDLVAGALTNAGDLTLGAGHVVTVGEAPTRNNGNLYLHGTLASTLNNGGRATLTFGGGRVTGAVVSRGEISGSGSIGGILRNHEDGTVDVGANDTLTVTGLTTNMGAMSVAGTFNGDVHNVDPGALRLNGGSIEGGVSNQGLLTGSGTIRNLLDNGMEGRVEVGQGQRLALMAGASNAGAIVLQGGRIDGGIQSSGTISGSGALGSALLNLQGGEVSVAQGDRLTLEAGADNQGLFTVAGTIAGDIANATTGTIALAGGRLENGLSNAGVLTGSGQLDARLNNLDGAYVRVLDGERIVLNQGVENLGIIELAGRLAGDVTNVYGGQLVMQGGVAEDDVLNSGLMTGSGTVSGRLHNRDNGQLEVGAGQSLNVVGGTTNDSRMTVAGVLRGAVENAATGRMVLSGGTLMSDVTNHGDLSGSGRLAAGLQNHGTASLAGTIDGTVTDMGQVTTSGDLTVTALRTAGTGHTLVTAGTALSLRNTAENEGNLTVDGVLRAAGTTPPAGGAGPVLVANTGTMSGSGQVEGVVENMLGGLFRMTGTVNGVLNQGEIALAANEALTVTHGISNENLLMNSGHLTSNIENRGLIANAGRISGNIANQRDAEIRLAGAVDGSINNRGRIETSGDGVVGSLQNREGGSLDVIAGHRLQVTDRLANEGNITLRGTLEGGVDNLQTGRVDLDGGVLDGDLASAGTIIGSGRVTGRLTNLNASAPLSVSGELHAGVLDNRESLIIERGGTLRVDRALENHNNLTLAGTLNGDLLNQLDATAEISRNAQINGNARNDGTIRVDRANITGTLTNNGIVDMQNRDVGGRVTLGGLDGTGTFRLDLNLADMTSDRVRVIGGPAAGNLYFDFDILSDATVNDLGARVTVVELDNAQNNHLNFAYEPISLSSARIVYELVQNRETGNLDVVSGTNPAIGALLGNVALTHSLIGSVINRPSSPYVVGMAYEDKEKPCGIGSWGRALGGTATAKGQTDNGIGSYASEVRARYYGMQVGTDLACFDGHFNGWNMAFGGLLGVNQGTTEQPNYANSNLNSIGQRLASVTKSDFSQIYGGLYMTASRDRWTVDLQYRHEVSDFDLNNDAFGQGDDLRLTDASFKSRANTISGAVSYTLPIGQTEWQFVPSAGFAWSKIKIDQIRFDDGYTLDFDNTKRKVGFLGGTVTRTFVEPADNAALNIFATGTYYKDFAKSTNSTFSLAGDPNFAPQHLKTDNLGAYTELSVGANYVKVLGGELGRVRQLSAGTRIDARFGDSLDSVGVTGQLRLQF